MHSLLATATPITASPLRKLSSRSGTGTWLAWESNPGPRAEAGGSTSLTLKAPAGRGHLLDNFGWPDAVLIKPGRLAALEQLEALERLAALERRLDLEHRPDSALCDAELVEDLPGGRQDMWPCGVGLIDGRGAVCSCDPRHDMEAIWHLELHRECCVVHLPLEPREKVEPGGCCGGTQPARRPLGSVQVDTNLFELSLGSACDLDVLEEGAKLQAVVDGVHCAECTRLLRELRLSCMGTGKQLSNRYSEVMACRN